MLSRPNTRSAGQLHSYPLTFEIDSDPTKGLLLFSELAMSRPRLLYRLSMFEVIVDIGVKFSPANVVRHADLALDYMVPTPIGRDLALIPTELVGDVTYVSCSAVTHYGAVAQGCSPRISNRLDASVL